jgi:hypothetical protein
LYATIGRFTPTAEEWELADPGLRRTLEALEASFDAALDRSEEEAADDLAFSLLQDSRLPVVLSHGRGYVLQLAGRNPAPVSTVGPDFIGAGDPLEVVAPSVRAVVMRVSGADGDGSGPPPQRTGATIVEILRGWARRGVRVELNAEGTFSGVLARACPDHVAVLSGHREVLVGSDAVRYVRRVPED